MTRSTLRRIGAPLGSAAATALVLTGALWLQNSRGAWPFDVATSSAGVERMDMQAPNGAGARHDRVPVEAAAARSLDIRLETVGREQLAPKVRAVATIVPDE